MPPLLAAVLLGAGAYAGAKAVHLLWTKLGALHEQAPEEASRTILEKDLGRLERDPATGIYRPSDKT